jgi:hypothetical protein
MLIVLTSPDALLRHGALDQGLVDVLKQARAAGNPTALVSNHAQPHWFDTAFGGSGVQFIQERGRQGGEIVTLNAKKFSLEPFDALVLATKAVDVQMGKNGGALLVAGEWSLDPQVAALGVRITSAADLKQIIDLTAAWPGKWWFSADASHYNVRALSDLSTKKYGLTGAQQAFAMALTSTVKNGGAKLNALLAVTARSLLMEGFGTKKDLVWGVYPSSKSSNDDTEVLSDFTHRLRTTVSRVRLAKKGEPLFIRHTPSSKRSAGGSGDRTNPSEQILTIHLNPYYAESGRLVGKHIVVIDDCTTYGVSFGVAAAFLRAADAASVTGIALGKFGSQIRYYEIDIACDPFKPVSAAKFKTVSSGAMAGATNSGAQSGLQNLID